MRNWKDVETLKNESALTKTEVIALPPGYIAGFFLNLDNNQIVIARGIANIRGKQVKKKDNTILSGEDFICHILPEFIYYIYLDSGGAFHVDSIEPTFDDRFFGYYHPVFSNYRYIGKAITDANTKWDYVVNQGAIGAEDADINTLQAMFARINELAAGYDGTGSFSSPSKGDYSLMIDNARMYLQKYLNGGWSDVNKLSFGLLVGSLVLNMIGCRGVIHPDADTSDLTGEELLYSSASAFDFEDTYAWTDQSGNEYNTELSDTGFAKYGDGYYSYDGSAVYIMPAVEYYTAKGNLAITESFAISVWLKPAPEPGTNTLRELCGITPNMGLLFGYGSSASMNESAVKACFNILPTGVFAVIDGVEEKYEQLDVGLVESWHLFYIIYDAETNVVILGCDNEYISGSLTSIPAQPYIRVQGGDDYISTGMFDDFFIIQSVAPSIDFFVKHYLSNLPWSTTYSYADTIEKCAPGGEIVKVGDQRITGQLAIDGASRVIAYSSGGSAIANATYVDLVYENEEADNLSEYNTTTGKFTAARAGFYYVKASIGFEGTLWAAGYYCILVIEINGTRKKRLFFHEVEDTENKYMIPSGSDLVELDAGDELNISVYQNTGGSINTSTNAENNYLAIHRLS